MEDGIVKSSPIYKYGKKPWEPEPPSPWKDVLDRILSLLLPFLTFAFPFLLLKAMHWMSKATCMHEMVNTLIRFDVMAHVVVITVHVLYGFFSKTRDVSAEGIWWGVIYTFLFLSIAFHLFALLVIFLVYLARKRC